MTVDIRPLRPSRSDRWDGLVERSERANTFYLFDALELQAEDTGTELHPLVGYDGETPVGVFPVFEVRKGPMTGAFSPPPKSWSTPLGPALVGDDAAGDDHAVGDDATGDHEHHATVRRSRRTVAFVEACLDWLDDRLGPHYQQFLLAGIDDVRPFQWNGFEVSPRFTYVVELGDEEALLAEFSRDARQNVRNADAERYRIERGGPDAVRYVVERVRERHREQDIPFQLDAAFAVALYRRLPEGTVRPYVCRVDGERVGGLLVLEHGGTVYRWLGGVKPDGDPDLPVNDLLDWHVMREATRRGLDEYDLVGAGDPSINRYKAKFNPDLRANYVARNGTAGVRGLVDLYSQAHFLGSKLRGVL
ncbi:GNAT family N-acetyltransferase [Halorussus salilacus]|uniref:lipid II:glycine glycyltransferase FemX n=1 Tax=Halorussus salilacus TaxID=2953750 RepID=UPI0020A05A7E|nr:GNAT family N-acetyltransferase [Halorussus salilacus]USZ69210.1 GNAT family N-acetyltransferase [Halorussus salilacus]